MAGTRLVRRAALALGLTGLVSGWVVIGAPPVHAATITVTNPADAGAGTLRQAVLDAAPGDTITFSSALIGVPIQVTSAEIQIAKNLTIRGNGSAFTLIQGNPPAGRIFRVTAGAVTIDAVTLRGATPVAVDGVGVRVDPGATLTLSRSQISDMVTTDDGGALRNLGTTTITNSVIADNRASGCGGLYNSATMTVSDTLVEDNQALAPAGIALGGGICSDGSTLTVTNSDVVSNDATAQALNEDAGGGGIAHLNGTMTLTDVAVRGNLAQVAGGAASQAIAGGVAVAAGSSATLDRVEVSENTVLGAQFPNNVGAGMATSGTTTLTNATFRANNAVSGRGGAIFIGGLGNLTLNSTTLTANAAFDGSNIYNLDTARAQNTIFNSPAPMCSGNAVVDLGANLRFPNDGTCPGVVADPLLGPLQFNGGPTRTAALSPGSPAINTGAGCPPVDQRNFPRVGNCDIGAYEFGATLNDVTPPACAITALRADNPRQMDVTVSDNQSGLNTVVPSLQQNAVINVPWFQRGTRNPVVVTATKVDQAQVSRWAFQADDLAGNSRLCS